MLIIYGYRIEDGGCDIIASHIRGVTIMMSMLQSKDTFIIDQLNRALFWQDLLSCLMVGRPRSLSHRGYTAFNRPKELDDVASDE